MAKFAVCFLLSFLFLLSPLSAADLTPSSALLRRYSRLSTLSRLLEHAQLGPELDRYPQLTILVPHDAALQQLLLKNVPPHQLAHLLRQHILPQYHSLNDLLALTSDAAAAVPTLYRPRADLDGALRFRVEDSESGESGSVLRVEMSDGSRREVRKSLLEVPSRISVLETSDLIASRATSPAASPTPTPAPAPAPLPVNVTQIMVAAGEYSTLISLLQKYKVDVTLQSLANQTQGVSIFCPTNKAFSSLPSGLLNNLTQQQTVNLLQYHAMPSFYPLSTFQQTSNSVFRTLASNYNGGNSYMLNVSNQQGIVVFATGYDKATLVSTLYNTDPGALFAVDHVLLPVEIVGIAAPTPAPSPSTPAPAPSKVAPGSTQSSTARAPSSEANDAPPLLPLRGFLFASLLFCGFKVFQL